MVTRLLTGILACVLVPLGAVFVVLGLVLDDLDRGEPEDFVYVGAPLLAAGLAFAAAFAVLRARERERGRRRKQGLRAVARVVRADWRSGIRVGAWLTYDLTVHFDAGGTVTRRVLVMPGTKILAGESIEILYDPDEPSNFEPA